MTLDMDTNRGMWSILHNVLNFRDSQVPTGCRDMTISFARVLSFTKLSWIKCVADCDAFEEVVLQEMFKPMQFVVDYLRSVGIDISFEAHEVSDGVYDIVISTSDETVFAVRAACVNYKDNTYRWGGMLLTGDWTDLNKHIEEEMNRDGTVEDFIRMLSVVRDLIHMGIGVRVAIDDDRDSVISERFFPKVYTSDFEIMDCTSESDDHSLNESFVEYLELLRLYEMIRK